MDVVLSIVAGLGLRLFLSFAADTGPSPTFTTTILGVWEGAVVHQVSARSNASRLDHLLAFGLRLTIDLLISKDFHRMAIVVIFSGLAASLSESVVPYARLRLAIKKEKEREKERRHRPSRSETVSVPILSAPLPPRIRAYKEPEHVLATSTPAAIAPLPIPSPTAQFQLPSPPSFFLQDSVVYSPATKPVHVSSADKGNSYLEDTLPVRPRSGVAAALETLPGSPPPIPVPLPTPPESAQSAVHSDGQHDNDPKAEPQNSRFDRQLYTIPELSSSEDGSQALQPPNQEFTDNIPDSSEANRPGLSTGIMNVPLPVPNADQRRVSSSNLARWLSSQVPDTNAPDTIFTHPFSSPPGAAPLPVPVRIRNQGSTPQERTPQQNQMEIEDVDAEGSVVPEFEEGDPLRTPPAQNAFHLATENDVDLDELQTPHGLVHPDAEDVLSPLALDVRSEPSRGPTPNADEPQSAIPIDEDLIPGSLSQNTLLQPPLPPSGPLIRKPIPPPESPPPPSPASLHSGLSEESVMSTRLPHRLYRRASELRQKAREEEKARAQIEEQRKTAEREGRPLEALFLKVKVRELDAETTKLHEKAARRYYAAHNTVEILDKIDVHGLRPREAFDRIERAIVKASGERKTVLRVIVGKGIHSVNQTAVLKPAVQREMQRLGLPCEVDPRNPGVLIVTLPQTPAM